MRHAYGNANGNCHIHSDGDCDGNCHIHSDGDSDRDIYCNGDSNSHGNCDRTAAAYTDATPSADTAGPSEHLLLRQF